LILEAILVCYSLEEGGGRLVVGIGLVRPNAEVFAEKRDTRMLWTKENYRNSAEVNAQMRKTRVKRVRVEMYLVNKQMER
jgi:hypothetical protein